MSIPFTQFLRPNGRQRFATIDRPEEIEAQALAVIRAGGRFTAEVLRTGHASIACEYEDEDIAIEVVMNGPKIPEAVDKVVKSAYKQLVEKETP
jgi:hypothetical protein